MKKKYDFIVIGSGPAGFSAAMEAAKRGYKALVVEKEYEVGGTCINTGTFPSKTLREATLYLTGFLKKNSYSFYNRENISLSMDKLRERLNHVRCQEHAIIKDQLGRNGIDLVCGKAGLLDKNTVQVRAIGENIKKFAGEYIILATGSEPSKPTAEDYQKDFVLDSTTFLNIKEIPKTLTIIGGGVIGTEYATIFGALGVEVHLLDRGERLLKFIDHELIEYLTGHLQSLHVNYHSKVGNLKITKRGEKVRVVLEDGKYVDSDALLCAFGRRAFTGGLNLEGIGIRLNQWDYIEVNDLYQTAVPNIYAVGDVIGWPSLASSSIFQGRLAVRYALNVKRHSPFPEIFPFGIYTIPEISYVGMTEEEAKAKKVHYVVGRSFYKELPRGLISGDLVGCCKMLVHAETREILGVHIIGHGATEVIHTALMAIQNHARTDVFSENIFNYPTYTEALRISALDANNRIGS
jgi:NAD(P) transhydrogenase